MTESAQIQPAELSGGLVDWIESSLASGSNLLATDNQGIVLLYEGDGRKLVIKSAMGRGALRKARQATLEREYAAYRRLAGVEGVPACYGLLEGRYLVLEFIEGAPYRHAVWQDRELWFAQLLEVIRAFHARGVSHGDLKSKTGAEIWTSCP